MCDEFHPYRSMSFHVIRSNRHGNKNCFFASFFIGTRERKDLQQPEPQRSVSAWLHNTVGIVSSDILSHVARMSIGHLNLRPAWGEGWPKRPPPCTFPSIAQKRKGIELRSFRNFLHQFYTCWLKENFAPMLSRPWVTWEWRHVLPF